MLLLLLRAVSVLYPDRRDNAAGGAVLFCKVTADDAAVKRLDGRRGTRRLVCGW